MTFVLPSTTTNPMKVSLCHFREVKINDNIDCLNVDTTGEEITANEVPAESGAEIMEDSVSVSLKINIQKSFNKLKIIIGRSVKVKLEGYL